MAYATATYADVSAFDDRSFGLGDYRRTLLNGVALSLGALLAVGAMAGSVTVVAGWMVGNSLPATSSAELKTPLALKAVALIEPYPGQPAEPEMADNAEASTPAAASATDAPESVRSDRLAIVAAPVVKKTTALAPVAVPAPVKVMPLPPKRPAYQPQIGAKPEAVSPAAANVPAANADAIAPKVAALVPPSAPLTSFNLFQKRGIAQQANSQQALPPQAMLPPVHDNPAVMPATDNRTALYDIGTHTVYLPNGDRLEAHSGLGDRMDDPHYVGEKDRGATPPNVYDLVLREGSFHGVQAIRLNPVDDGKMYGRDGILAHPYMLGPSGQSFGCVSFRDYPAFLHAFLNGKVDRLVVVPHLERKPPATAHGGPYDRSAANNDRDLPSRDRAARLAAGDS